MNKIKIIIQSAPTGKNLFYEQFIKQKGKFDKVIDPSKLYAVFSNTINETDKLDYQTLGNIKRDIKKVVRNNFKIKNTSAYNYLELSNYERIGKVKALYQKIAKLVANILKREFQHDDKLYEELKRRLYYKVSNKIRTDKTGKVFIMIAGKKYFGDIEGYEKMFVDSKLNFKNVFKAIVREIVDALENDTPETGKAFLTNEKEEVKNG